MPGRKSQEEDIEIPVDVVDAADFWDILPPEWPHFKYDLALSRDIDALFQKYSKDTGGSVRRVLDCGCGTGNPGIGLAKAGYDLTCIDADPTMLKKFRSNREEAGVSVNVIEADWRHLNGDVNDGEPYDAAICRGNSLIYAGCWERRSFSPIVASKAIEVSMKNIFKLLRPGGLLYVDITAQKEYDDAEPKREFIGERESEKEQMLVWWDIDYDTASRTRRVYGNIVVQDKAQHRPTRIMSHLFTSYILYHNELIALANKVGFEGPLQGYAVPAEKLYDVFLFKKPTL